MKLDVKKIALLALFTSLVVVFTMFPSIPVPKTMGYIHLGDSVIFLACHFFGYYAIIPAALGGAIADLIMGYALYLPITLVVKGAMAAAFVLVYKSLRKARYVLASLVAVVVLVLGYFVGELILTSQITMATVTILSSTIQGVASVTVASGLITALKNKLKM